MLRDAFSSGFEVLKLLILTMCTQKYCFTNVTSGFTLQGCAGVINIEWTCWRKVDIMLPGKGNLNFLAQDRSPKIISMIKWIRNSGLSIKILSLLEQAFARLAWQVHSCLCSEREIFLCSEREGLESCLCSERESLCAPGTAGAGLKQCSNLISLSLLSHSRRENGIIYMLF